MQEVVGPHGVERVRLHLPRLPPRLDRTRLARPEARQAEVELGERAARIQGAELLHPVERGSAVRTGPAGERRTDLGLERVVPLEEPSGLGEADRRCGARPPGADPGPPRRRARRGRGRASARRRGAPRPGSCSPASAPPPPRAPPPRRRRRRRAPPPRRPAGEHAAVRSRLDDSQRHPGYTLESNGDLPRAAAAGQGGDRRDRRGRGARALCHRERGRALPRRARAGRVGRGRRARRDPRPARPARVPHRRARARPLARDHHLLLGRLPLRVRGEVARRARLRERHRR